MLASKKYKEEQNKALKISANFDSEQTLRPPPRLRAQTNKQTNKLKNTQFEASKTLFQD